MDQATGTEELNDFETVLREWLKKTCRGECNNGSDVCACAYRWKCPGCGKKVDAVGEDFGDAVGISGGQCPECFTGVGNEA
jgi:hypothetical protein